jgi:hypothetical protein
MSSVSTPIALGINIDHVATVRQARRATYPDPVHAALLAEQAGADNITLHLREDRRHIQDRDVRALRPLLLTRMNLDDPSEPARTLGLWTRGGGALLTVNQGTSTDLDVDVLSSTLPQMIGVTTDELNANGRLTYTSDARQAIAAVDSGEADVCFLVRPTPVESVLSVASDGGFMPPKSTFFHPKAATGLVVNPLWSEQ